MELPEFTPGLSARVELTDEHVVWRDFRQPYRFTRAASEDRAARIGWDYSAFGPFVFERQAYERALRLAIDTVPKR